MLRMHPLWRESPRVHIYIHTSMQKGHVLVAMTSTGLASIRPWTSPAADALSVLVSWARVGALTVWREESERVTA